MTHDGISWATNDYCNLYGNGNAYSSTTGGSHNTLVNPLVNGLTYLPRIESGSTLKTAGSSGGQIGAQIEYKLGTSGSLYGETGWNTLTSDSLWPFPNEDVIRERMRVYNLHDVNGARGFCADGQTLTKYIWEYLGNTIPVEIYESGRDSAESTSGNNANSVSSVESPISNPVVGGSNSGGGGGGGSCFIASAVYGANANETKTLREFRDGYLLKSKLGNVLVKLYYISTPPIAHYLEKRIWAKNVMRKVLNPLVALVNQELNKR